MDESVRLRTATDEDRRAIADLLIYVFNEHATDELRELEKLIIEPGRSMVAEDDGRVVGTAAAQTREMTIPGGVLPTAHVTGVGVSPTHRRRGILTSMMRGQLLEIAEAGREPVAALWASETAIYPRFGYGPASSRLRFDILSREVKITAPAAPPGRLRLVVPAAARAELTAVHDDLRIHRVGWSSRPDYWWQYLLTESDGHRNGATESRGVLYETAEGPVGYALWRVKNDWGAHGPAGEVRVREVVAGNPGVYAELWRFLLSLDLARTASYHYGALDEPLQFIVDEPRKLGRSFQDALWVRLVDLPTALEARRYACPVDAVFEVTDPIIEANNGRWRLTGGPDKASCVRTQDAPDFACSITELGAAYLGGTTLATLHTAGRIEKFTDNLPSTAFTWLRQPSSIEVF
ncbi:GNAT family N-acetyltransferase [Actinoplanes sp. LDG1-06]|uniref:GNAT family N-acetyltransferase n=1 Tax=Paractinoplanes ovalisporus TaxID=2810368 RepID=A0ABS2AUJ2_9ACTN|nr:GNAT family N-acetyltransferase [Actinoplanes ovalisporus]MBM2623532.1 GNAT family N-acetyltransferase [Actinoplanes ovalisporus]